MSLFERMKLKLLPIIAVCALLTASCADYKSQIEELQGEIDKTTEVLSGLESVSANLGALRDLLAFAEAGDFIENVVPGGNGVTFTFKNNGSVTVGGNTAGISVDGADGGYYWTLDGAPLKDASGANAKVSISPKFHSKDGKPQVSTDSGKTWKDIAADGESVIKKVEEEAGCFRVTLLGGAELVLPKESLMEVMISGDSSTIPTQSRVILDYYITGGSGEYTVATSQPGGWSPRIIKENAFKGQIVYVVSGTPDSDEVVVYVSDDAGHMKATVLDLSTLVPDQNFPQLHPSYDAYNIGCDGGTVEVLLNTNLEYEIDAESASWLTLVSPKAVRQDKIIFSATANDAVEMRSARVTFTSGAYSRVVMICQDGRRPSVGTNLSENGTANCYIVPAAGDYCFDATVIGNGRQGIIADAGFHTETVEIQPAEVEIMTEIDEDVTLIEDLRLEDGKIYFHATGNKGNLTLVVFDEEGRVLWSWHLWFTDIPLEKAHTNDNGKQFILLDRNLGATSANPEDGEATYGLYYQWGRKDPFAGNDILSSMASNNSGTIAYGVIRPFRALKTGQGTSYNWISTIVDGLWGNPDHTGNATFDQLVKTIYDPCPPGYMVPPANTFVILSNKRCLQFIVNGIVLRGDYGQTSFYPYAGRVYQGSWEAFGHHPENICLALWTSDVGIYNSSVYDGGSSVYYEVSKDRMRLNHGDFRARGIPVRCVKQQ